MIWSRIARPLLWAMMSLMLAGTGVTGFAQETASSWPSKPINIVRINAPGTSNDRELRQWTDKMTVDLGKPFVFDYREGASGTIGAAYVAKAVPDGYTFLNASSSFTVAPLFRKVPFDVVKDFAAVSLLSSNDIILIANSELPANNLTEYIAYTKASPGKVFWADSGATAANYVTGERLHRLINTKVTFVHFKAGGSTIFPDLMAGRVNVYPSSIGNAISLVKTGKVKPIVTLSLKRSKAFPDVMTADEQGLTDFEQPNYSGFVAPAGTDPAILQKMFSVIAKTAKSPDIVALEAEGKAIIANSPAEFSRYIVKQMEIMKELVKDIKSKS